MKTVFDVIANDRASAALGRIRGAMRGLGGSARTTQAEMRVASMGMRGVMGGMKSGFEMMAVGGGMLKAGGGIVSALGGAEKLAGEYSMAMASVGAKTKATAQEMIALGKAAKRAGIETQYTPLEAADALEELGIAGFNATESVKTLGSSLALAAASKGGLGVGESAGVISQAVKAFGVDIDDAGNAADKMVRMTNMFRAFPKDLPMGLSNISRGAQAMNQNFDESIITFGFLKNTISRVATASMAGAIGMERMTDPKVQKALHNLGVEVVGDDKKFRNYLDVVADLAEAPKLLAKSAPAQSALLQSIFGSEGQRALSSIMPQLRKGITTANGEILKGAAAVQYYREELKGSAGEAQRIADALLDTSEGQKLLLKGSQQTAAISIGGALAGLFKPIVKAQIGTINTFIEAFDALPPIARQTMVGFVGVTGVFVKMLGATILLGGAMRMLGISFTGLLLTMGKVLLVSVPLMGFIGALGVGFYGLYRASQKNVGGVGDTFSGMWSKVKLGFRATIDLIGGGGLSEAVKKDMRKAENQGVGKFITWITEKIGIAKAFFKGLVAGFDSGLERLSGPFGRLKTQFLGLFGIFSTEGGDVQNKLDNWTKSGETLGDKFADLALFAGDFAVRGLKMIESAFERITMEDVTSTLENILTIFQAMAKAAELVADGIQKAFDLKTAYGAVGKSTSEMSTREMLAVANVTGGTRARKNLETQFGILDQMVEKGVINTMTARVNKVVAAKQQLGITTAQRASFASTGSVGAMNERVRASGDRAEKSVSAYWERMDKNLQKLADKDFSLSVDGERFASLVGSVFDTQEERDYQESVLA